jgi:CRP-like cAMP-binding protein
LIAEYFTCKEARSGETIYRQGDISDSIDFVASGTLAIMLDDGRSPPRRIRRSTRQTVLGEMGFFRNARRAATIAAEEPAVIYSLDRPRLERMQREHPEAYAAFLRFVVRTLSDRLEHAHRELAALDPPLPQS